MLEQWLNVNLPQKYQDDFIEYHPTLDGLDGFELRKMGIDESKVKKMLLLYEIERMKFLIKEPTDFTDEEIAYAQKRIDEDIEKYNSMIL